MSGTTPECWNANIFPVRPRPHWISSKTRSAPRSSADGLEAPQELRRRGPDPALALDGLDHHRRGLVVDGRGHRREVVARDEAHAGHERLEGLAVLRGPGGRQAPIERPWNECSKTTYSIRPCVLPDAAGELHRPLPRLGARVREEDLRREGELHQALGEGAPGLGVEEIARVDELLRLLLDRGRRSSGRRSRSRSPRCRPRSPATRGRPCPTGATPCP